MYECLSCLVLLCVFAHVSLSMAICYISADDEMFIVALVCMRIYQDCFMHLSVCMMKKMKNNLIYCFVVFIQYEIIFRIMKSFLLLSYCLEAGEYEHTPWMPFLNMTYVHSVVMFHRNAHTV